MIAIRPRTLRRRLAAVAAGAALAATAVGFGFAPDAQASPLSYIQSLNNRGITVYDASLTIANGYVICEQLNTYNGVEVTNWVYANTSYADVPTPAVAAIFVVTAVEELCSWHDHRGEATA